MPAFCSHVVYIQNKNRQRQTQQQKEVMRDTPKNKRQHENVGSTVALKKENGSEIE